jgi:prevent-host-death family protein
MGETIPFTEAKAHLSELVDRTSREHERFMLTRNGRPAAILLSRGLGIEVRSGQISVDEHGRVVIDSPELAEAVKAQLSAAPSAQHINVNCGCDPN